MLKFMFSNPEPVKNWEGINLATKDGNMCPQPLYGTVNETKIVYF